MREANGDTRNHVMWRGSPVPFDKAWMTFAAWMEAIAADGSAAPAREKTIRDRPVAAVDGCWTSPTDFIDEPQGFSRQGAAPCNARFPSYGFPRLVAGGPLAADVLKCQLKPVDLGDYTVRFTAAEWTRLQHIFPSGVCDWRKPGVQQTGVVPWASFGPAPENLVFDVSRQR
jgi:hypothetical protein